MAKKRKIYRLRNGDIIDIEEYHDGLYGAPGKKRQQKKKKTKEDIRRINAFNKAKRARLRLLEYFNPGDLFVTWTYEVKNRPPDMAAALKDFQKAIRKVRQEYGKQERALFWIRNIEAGTKGAWHIHLVVNEIGDTASILRKVWSKGGIYISEIRNNDKIYDADFTKLANYITKDENTVYEKEDGTPGKPRIREASYNTSRNTPLPEPKTKPFTRWQKEVKPQKGYYISAKHEGINPVTGFKYRRYTMIRLERRDSEDRNLHRDKRKESKAEKRKVRGSGGMPHDLRS